MIVTCAGNFSGPAPASAEPRRRAAPALAESVAVPTARGAMGRSRAWPTLPHGHRTLVELHGAAGELAFERGGVRAASAGGHVRGVAPVALEEDLHVRVALALRRRHAVAPHGRVAGDQHAE